MEALLQHLSRLWESLVLFSQSNAWFAPIVSILVALLAIGRRVVRRFGQRVLTQIEEKLNPKADRLADRLVELPETWIAVQGFRRRYDQSLVYALRDFRVQGLKTRGAFVLDLQKVFVPLRVAPESIDKIPSALLSVKEAGKDFSIWDFLAAIDAQPAFRRLVVLGPPGSGKSTLLERLTLTYAQNTQRQQHRQAPNLTPILVYLRDVRETVGSENPPSLPALLEQQDTIRKLNPPTGWFETRLQQGKCLVMLDGLDEVADASQRQQVSRWVAQQMQTYPKSCFILTSRPFGYKTAPLEQVTSIEVQPFNLTQMQQFVNNWYLQNEIMSRLGKDDPGVRQVAAAKANDLIRRIQHNPPLAVMALNPLLLTMIATVHCYRGALPGRRVELYAEICDVLLGRRQEAKGMPDRLTAAQKQTVLQVLALKGMQRNTREFKLVTACLLIRQRLETVAGSGADPEQFIRQIENISGLLVEREQGIYEFAHKSFQEYLAAVQTKEIHQEMLLARHIDDPWWEETIRLYAAQTNASYLIQTAIDRNTVGALTIAYDCLQEGLSIDAKIRRALETTLEEGLESTDPEIFKLAAEVKLSRRLKNLLRIDEKTEIDMSYITCAEYQLFIDEKQLEWRSPGRFWSGESHQPDHWQSYRFAPGNANEPILGVRASDAIEFCRWLTARSGVLGDVYEESGSLISVGATRFRLPKDMEVQEYVPIQQARIGCWAQDDESIFIKIDAIQLQVWEQILTESLTTDLAHAVSLFGLPSEVFSFACAIIPRISLNSSLNFDLVLEFELQLEQIINDLTGNLAKIDRSYSSSRNLCVAISYCVHNYSVYLEDFNLVINLMDYRDCEIDDYITKVRPFLALLLAAYCLLVDEYEKNSRISRLQITHHVFQFLNRITAGFEKLKQQLLYRALNLKLKESKIAKRNEILMLYTLITLLNERRSQNLPAWEGIRIVREQI